MSTVPYDEKKQAGEETGYVGVDPHTSDSDVAPEYLITALVQEGEQLISRSDMK